VSGLAIFWCGSYKRGGKLSGSSTPECPNEERIFYQVVVYLFFVFGLGRPSAQDGWQNNEIFMSLIVEDVRIILTLVLPSIFRSTIHTNHTCRFTEQCRTRFHHKILLETKS
jgi:hypothetical protein